MTHRCCTFAASLTAGNSGGVGFALDAQAGLQHVLPDLLSAGEPVHACVLPSQRIDSSILIHHRDQRQVVSLAQFVIDGVVGRSDLFMCPCNEILYSEIKFSALNDRWVVVSDLQGTGTKLTVHALIRNH